MTSKFSRTQHRSELMSDVPDHAHLPTQRRSNGTPQEPLRDPPGRAIRPALSTSVGQGKRPEGSNSTRSRSDRSELPAEDLSPRPPPRTRAQTQWVSPPPQPKATFMRNIDTYTTSNSSSVSTPSIQTRSSELRTARRMPSSRMLVPESSAAAGRAVELPAFTPRNGFVSSKSPLSELQRRLDTASPRPAFNGYASEEDVSQLGSTVWESEPGC